MAYLREQNHSLNNYRRNAVLAAVLSVMGSSAESQAEGSPRHAGSLPLCRDLSGHSTPDGSVWLEGNEEGEVVCVVDGDTFDIQNWRIRLVGINAAESGTQQGTLDKNKLEVLIAQT